jgi:nucleoside-diphosphate-sugar epimerase
MKHTILVTGGTGYIGSWVVKGLLEHGHTVRLTVRNLADQPKYQFLLDIAKKSAGSLEIREADLLNPGSFDDAAKGCDLIAHMASPFILTVKNPQKDLVDPAVKGTVNVLEAATRSGTVKKVVLTSSVAAVHGDNSDMKNQNLEVFTEEQFNTSSSLAHQPYSFSKVEAEKKAWEMAKKQSRWELVVINPSFVMGPPLSLGSKSESMKMMADLLSGRYKTGVPDLIFGFVDVRDVARAHIYALENPAEGRHILAGRVTNLPALVNIIRSEFGDAYKLPKSVLPKWVMALIGGFFGISGKFVRNNVGIPIKLDSSKSRDKLKLEYIPLEQTVKDMVEQMKSLSQIPQYPI